MFFLNMFERRTNWDNRDYRDYRDHRTRQKRRLRLRISMGVTLLVCLLLAVGLGTVSARVRAQLAQPIEAAPVLSAPIRLQGPDDPAAHRDIQRLKVQANAPGRIASTNRAGGSVPQTAAPVSAARAAWLLGLIYLHGSGVARDPIQAALWFERARVLGEPLSSAGLAWCEIEGCKGSPDPAGARRWIAQLRSVNPAQADYLEWVVQSRLSPVQLAVPQPGQTSPGAAMPSRELLLRSAQRGDVNARIELGLESVAAGNLAAAQEHFKAASPRSAAAAANLTFISNRIKTGASASSPASMSEEDLLANAQRFHRGEGRPANYAEAIRLYRLAESKGSIEARRMLALIFSRPTPTGELDVQWMQELSQLNLSKDAPALNTVTGARMLQREPSPLFDLLPEVWRKRTLSVIR
jgi:TPR repeat protein